MNLRNNFIIRNLREWLTLAILIFGFIYLTADPEKSIPQNSDSFGTPQIVLESADNSDSTNSESDSKDVSGSSNPTEESTSWIVEVDIATIYGKSNRQIYNGKSQFANQTPHKKLQNTTDSKNTLSLVDSDLAHQFTLLGEKPSGTS